jgi:hypothetical protein
MKRIIGLGIGGLLTLVVGLVLPHLPDSSLRHDGPSSFQATAALCARRPVGTPVGPPRVPPQVVSHFSASCATASDMMNLGAWLVVLSALALAVTVSVLILGQIRRRPALSASSLRLLRP